MNQLYTHIHPLPLAFSPAEDTTVENCICKTQIWQLCHVWTMRRPPRQRPSGGLPGSWSATEPQARLSLITVSGRGMEHVQIRVHQSKQSLLTNHLFKQDKTSPYCFLLYRKSNISNILTFLFNKISFDLVPGTALHFRIHVSTTHMHPLQPEEHTVRKTQRKMCKHRSTDAFGLWMYSDTGWSVLDRDRIKGRPLSHARSPSERSVTQDNSNHSHRWTKGHTPSKHS